MRMLTSLAHIGMLATYIFTTYCSFYVLHVPALDRMFTKFNPGQFKYLTIWNIILQALYFLICLLNDWYGTNAVNPKKPPLIRKVKDYMYATLSFPLAMFVGVTFWSLMFVDRELVLPKALDPYFPWWLNHLMHTVIMVSAIIEMLLTSRQYPKRSRGLGGLSAFMLVYLIWMHVVYYKSGIWVYPVMDVLTPPLRIVFFAVLLTFTMILYCAGEMLNNLVWGNEQTKKHKSHSK